MNRKKLQDWELKLGSRQVAALLGVVFVISSGVFYLAFMAGHRRGIDSAMSNAAQVPRFPLTDQGEEDYLRPEDVSRVYEKLAGRLSIEALDEGVEAEESLPEIASIQTTAERPFLADLPAAGAQVPPQKTLGALLRPPEDPPGAETEKAALKPLLAEPRAVQEPAVVPEVKVPEVKAPEVETTVAPTPPAVRAVAEARPAVTATPPVVAERKATPPITEPVVSRRIAPGWYAQVSAPESLAEARDLAQKLRSSGFKAYIEEAEVRAQRYYRVLVGPEENRNQVEVLRRQLQRERYLKGDPFIKLVN